MNFNFEHILILALTHANNKKLKRDDFLILIVHLFLCVMLIILLLAFPGLAHQGTDQGVELFFEALFPYLLPYLILTQWLLRLTASFDRPLSTAKLYTQTYIISALGGFPTSAATIAFLKNNGQLTVREASMLLAICHAPSPLFILGFVSSDLLNDYAFGWKLLLIIHGFNILLLILYTKSRSKNQSTNKQPIQQHSLSPFSESMRDSAPVLLLVGITIVFFTTILTILLALITTFSPNLPSFALLIFTASLEMTNGLNMANSLFGDNPLLPILLVSILAIQSLSIHLQIIVLARTTQLSIKPYITLRLISFIVLPLLFWIFFAH